MSENINENGEFVNEEVKPSSKEKFRNFMGKVNRALHNRTFLYILRRILTSLVTLILLVAIVTALIRLLPDTKFYSIKDYNTIRGKSGIDAAERYRIATLSRYGICRVDGTRVSVIETIFKYIYYILPIYKKIPITWTQDYSSVLKYWTGTVFLGRGLDGTYVADALASRMGISFGISIVTVLLTYIFSIPLGIAMAKKPGGTVDKIGNVFIVLNYAIPGLVFYLTMNMILGDANGPFGFFHFDYSYEEGNLQTLFPPIFCAVFLSIPGLSIWIRRFMIDELSSDYVKFARSKGLSENKIMYTHVLRNAIIPLVRNIPATFIGAIIGSYYIEYIWGIPGTGILLITGLQTYDVAYIQGLTFLYAAMSMLSFLLGDLITVFADPRIRLED